MVLNYVICFGLGAVGALVIVWLRWIEVLPRFKSAIEIAKLEEEFDIVSKDIINKLQKELEVDCCEVTHSENLRDDIWRQRCISFLVSAFMYVFLGGVTALIFVGLDLQNVLESTSIIKLISAGALWSSFYSFIEVKNADKYGFSKMNEEKNEMAEKVVQEWQEKVEDANRNLQWVSERYNNLLKEYEKKLNIKTGHEGAS